MQGYGEVETTALSVEDLLSLAQQRTRVKTKKPKRERVSMRSRLGSFPVTTLIIVMLVIALGAMVTVLKAEIMTLKSDLSDLKNIRAQVAALDPKMEIASLESKVDTKLEKQWEDSMKEQERLRSELARVTANVEAMRYVRQAQGKKR